MKSDNAPRPARAIITRAKNAGRTAQMIEQPPDASHKLASSGSDKIAYLTARPLAFSDPAWAHQQPSSSFELSYPDYPDPIDRRAHPPFDMPHLSHLAHLDHLDHAAAPRRAALLQAQDIAERIALIKEAHGLIERSGKSKHGLASGVAYPSPERLAAKYKPSGKSASDKSGSFSQSSVKRSATKFDLDLGDSEQRLAPRRLGAKDSKPKRRHSRAELSPPERFDTNIA